MDIVKVVLESKNIAQAFKLINLDFVKSRYAHESLVIGYLAAYALNKEKNKNKPNFEDLILLDIFSHLVSEVQELKHELKQDKIDYERVLSEVSDIAALCVGITAWVMEHKDDKNEEV